MNPMARIIFGLTKRMSTVNVIVHIHNSINLYTYIHLCVYLYVCVCNSYPTITVHRIGIARSRRWTIPSEPFIIIYVF